MTNQTNNINQINQINHINNTNHINQTNHTNHINKTAIITGASRGIGAAIAKSWLPVAITSHFAAAIHLTG